MKDINICYLNGVIGDDFKFATAVNGKEYFTFSLITRNSYYKDFADSEEKDSVTYSRVSCFDKSIVKYMHDVKAHRGMRVSVFGRLSSNVREYQGRRVGTTMIIVRQISVVQRTATDKDVAEEKED